MSHLQFTVIVSTVLLAYLIVAFWRAPRTDSGRLARKLCLVNLISWVVVLPLDVRGDPPPAVIVGGLLWLLNLPIIIGTITALWVSIRAREENKTFLTASAIFVILNVGILWITPIVFLLT